MTNTRDIKRLLVDKNTRGRREIILKEANPMSGVFQNIDPPSPSPSGECVPPAFGAGGGHTRWVERGVGVNILEDAIHSSVLYICKYFVLGVVTMETLPGSRRSHVFLVARLQMLLVD